MNAIRIRLFGGLDVASGTTPLPSIPTQRARSLLAYLALHRNRFLHRDVVCGVLWGDQSDAEARKALRSALWRIRSVLEPGSEDRGKFLRVDGEQLCLPGTAEVWVDTAEFEACVACISPDRTGELPSGEAERLTRAASLYQGHLLEGFYEDWCFLDRERFRLAHLTALERLLGHYRARGQWLAAISVGRELLRADPLREHVHRQLMTCHLGMGDRPSALRQFTAYEDLLRRELGIEPLEETAALYRWIRDHGTLPNGSGNSREARLPDLPPSASAPAPLTDEIEDAVRSLQSLISRLESARAAAGLSEGQATPRSPGTRPAGTQHSPAPPSVLGEPPARGQRRTRS